MDEQHLGGQPRPVSQARAISRLLEPIRIWLRTDRVRPLKRYLPVLAHFRRLAGERGLRIAIGVDNSGRRAVPVLRRLDFNRVEHDVALVRPLWEPDSGVLAPEFLHLPLVTQDPRLA